MGEKGEKEGKKEGVLEVVGIFRGDLKVNKWCNINVQEMKLLKK